MDEYISTQTNLMKITYPYTTSLLLSILLVAIFEYSLVLLTHDVDDCFLHNRVAGNIILWMIRIPICVFLSTFLYNLFLPKYASLKDRMMDRA